ncbi:MAG TPA: efflux transporter outer membrane subunit [Saprospiraceae bacterium]|nr:efflux transporter outer membrane subunit [Saprospiraceae bacterium]
MNIKLNYFIYAAGLLVLIHASCKTPVISRKMANPSLPSAYINSHDNINDAIVSWRKFFSDPNLEALIDSALEHNQELNITLQEIGMLKNEVNAKRGEYLPFVTLGSALGPDRAGKYTWNGFSEEDLKQSPDRGPKYIGDFLGVANMSWELDVWKKLRNAKQSAMMKYLSSVDAKNFLITNLVSEISSSYFELLALDNLFEIIKQNIEIQSNALNAVKLQKDAAKVNQLAVNRFEALLLNTMNLQYEVQQKITETENRINFMLGRVPQTVQRNSTRFNIANLEVIHAGLPSQLIRNRPDILMAEKDLEASKLDVAVAKANFLPSFKLSAGLGFQAFNPIVLLHPESILYNVVGDVMAPLVNKNAIKAMYYNANLKQIQSAYNYEMKILNAYVEVINQLNGLSNYSKSVETKQKEVEILNQSVEISNNLFLSARADYIEVLLTQREALESKIELVEIKLKQMMAKINIYKALGGGWK